MINRFFLLLMATLWVFAGFGQGFGTKNGPWQSTYPDGSLKSKGQFKNDVPYGEFVYFYKSGKTKATMDYRDNGKIAYNTSLYESGQLMAQGKYVNQLKDSIWSYYGDSANQLISTETYNMGVLDGKSITYYPGTSQPTEIVIYEKGKKQGPLKKYFPDGSVMTDGQYKNDQLDGPFTLYYPDGKIQLKGTYTKGSQTGDWKYYNDKGEEMDYEDFVKQSVHPIEATDPDNGKLKISPY